MLKLATLCYVKRPGQTLMLHRIKRAGDMHAGKWNGLGGKFEPGETPEECAVREIYEESGLQVYKPELRGLLTFPSFRPDEDWYAFVFVVHEFAGELIESVEGKLEWIDDDKLLDLPLWEGDRIFLKWLDGDRCFSAKFTYVDGRFADYHAVFYPGAEVVSTPTATVAPSSPATISVDSQVAPIYTPVDDTYCWVCGGPVLKRHCKIVCQACGFRRDCGDP